MWMATAYSPVEIIVGQRRRSARAQNRLGTTPRKSQRASSQEGGVASAILADVEPGLLARRKKL